MEAERGGIVCQPPGFFVVGVSGGARCGTTAEACGNVGFKGIAAVVGAGAIQACEMTGDAGANAVIGTASVTWCTVW